MIAKAPSGCCRWRTAAKLVAWLLLLLALFAIAPIQRVFVSGAALRVQEINMLPTSSLDLLFYQYPAT